jgi:hypothetical protein
MAIDEGTVSGASGFEVDTGRVLVRPYIGDYECPDADHALGVSRPAGPVPVLRLAPRARRLRVPVSVGRHRRPRVLARKGRRRSVLLAVGAVAVVGTLAVGLMTPHSGRRLATPGWLTPTGASVPDVPGQPGGSSRPGDPTDPGGSTQPTDSPGGAPTSGVATTPGPGTPPASPLPAMDPGLTPAPGAGTPTAQPDPSPQPPTVAAAGQITNVAGLCLEATANGGYRVRLWDCNGTTGQVWTLAADGTLRAIGRCVQSDTGLVRLRDCNGDPAQQWRTGPAGSLVNPASARCLGDPRSDADKGTPQRTAPCDQSDPQRWALPGAG